MSGRTMQSDVGGAARRERGFSLIETLIAAALIGIGVAAMLVATKSATQVNAAGQEITQAGYLAQEIREWTLKLPFIDPDPGDASNPPGPDGSDPQVFVDDLDDLMNVTYSPPRDANGNAIAGMDAWSQTLTLEWKNPDSLLTAVPDGSSDIVRVNVDIARNGRPVLSAGWLVARR